MSSKPLFASREAVVMAQDSTPVTVDLDTGATRAGWPGDQPYETSSVDVERSERARELWAIDPRIELLAAASHGRVLAVAGDLGLLYVIGVATMRPVAVHRFDGPVEGVTLGLDGRAYTMDRATGRLLSVAVD